MARTIATAAPGPRSSTAPARPDRSGRAHLAVLAAVAAGCTLAWLAGYRDSPFPIASLALFVVGTSVLSVPAGAAMHRTIRRGGGSPTLARRLSLLVTDTSAVLGLGAFLVGRAPWLALVGSGAAMVGVLRLHARAGTEDPGATGARAARGGTDPDD